MTVVDPLLAALVLLIVLAAVNILLLLRRPAEPARLAHILEQSIAQARADTETTRGLLADSERALAGSLATLSTSMVRDQGAQHVLLETKLREMSDQAALRLGAIQHAVNETLATTVEKQMTTSFQRVIDQFGQVQKAMTDVQAVTAQIGDLKRIFSNVKQRGTWGETHLRALLEDMFPQGGWEANRKLREGSDEIVEFAVVMPVRGPVRPLLALDAKFPVEDYDRLLLAAEGGDVEGERAARRGLELRLRSEARKIGEKYVVPPVTVDFAVMYLPTDGLYVEAARIPGLIESLNRDHRVLVMGPSLAPALLRTILLGTLTLSIEQRAHDIQNLLGAVRSEMVKMDGRWVRWPAVRRRCRARRGRATADAGAGRQAALGDRDGGGRGGFVARVGNADRRGLTMSVTVTRGYSFSYRPAVARGLIIVALTAGMTAGFVVGTRAAPVPEVELLHLLRAMAVLKVAFIAAAAGAVWWRLQAPIGPGWLTAYATVFGAMAAGPVLIWYSSHLILASVLLHVGIAAAMLLLWRENAAADLLRGVVARRRSTSRG